MYTRRTQLQKYHISVPYPEHIFARASSDTILSRQLHRSNRHCH